MAASRVEGGNTPRVLRSTSGQYASHWNAFLLFLYFIITFRSSVKMLVESVAVLLSVMALKPMCVTMQGGRVGPTLTFHVKHARTCAKIIYVVRCP